MSCFPGQMKLYRELSIDRFDNANLHASAYFLSHCHSDHMVGLANGSLEKRLLLHPAKLYVSEVTKTLLLEDSRYHFLKPYVHVLPIEEPKIIHFFCKGASKEVTVTLLPAGHCLGSVMFLFEGNEGTCLYTGDFRLPKGSAARMKCLHSGQMLKKIDHLHLDTTFCIPDAFYIPSREQCLNVLTSVVGEWLSKGDNRIVRLNVSAKYGYEYLYKALFEKFGNPIYCARAKHYQCLPDIARIFTDDANHSRIFACFKKEKVKKKDSSRWERADMLEGIEDSKHHQKSKLLRLTLSTMYFTHAASPDEIKILVAPDHYRLCFSFHSSLSEVCDLVRYLKPQKLHANVIPRTGESFNSVEERLRRLCFSESFSETNRKVTYKPLGKLNHRSNANGRTGPVPKKRDVSRRKIAIDDAESSDEEFHFIARKRKVSKLL